MLHRNLKVSFSYIERKWNILRTVCRTWNISRTKRAWLWHCRQCLMFDGNGGGQEALDLEVLG